MNEKKKKTKTVEISTVDSELHEWWKCIVQIIPMWKYKLA